jgi:tetrapyrrole methylase family protein / MazG family protein
MNNTNQPTVYATPLAQTEAIWQAVGGDRTHGYQTLPAAVVTRHYYPPVEVSLPLLITQVEAGATPLLQRTLINAYPRLHPLTLAWVDEAGTVQSQFVTLQELSAQPIPTTAAWLYVPPLPANHSFSALQNIVAQLRSPEGCPWDRKQTLATMRHDLLGECAEVLEAIDAASAGQANDEQIAEELGDLLMTAVLIFQIATEAERFRLGDAMTSVVTKLIRRHPHVFGATVVGGVQEVLTNWDAIKAQEKAAKGLAPAHPLEGVPAALPALEKARQLQSKARKAGILPPSTAPEIVAAIRQVTEQAVTETALGALLWQIVNLAQTYDVNPEDALRQYSVHFTHQASMAP